MIYKVVADKFNYECDSLDQACSAFDILSKYVEFYSMQTTVHMLSGQTVWKEYLPAEEVRPDIKAALKENCIEIRRDS